MSYEKQPCAQNFFGLTIHSARIQAIEADRKEDREIICGEVFTDLTGTLDDLAKGILTSVVTQQCSCVHDDVLLSAKPSAIK